MRYTRENLRQIFESYRLKIYNLALRMARKREDAEDILQNTFLKVIKNIKYFRNESALSTWIYRIAINEAKMKWRKDKSLGRLVKLEKEDLTNRPQPLADKQLEREELKNVVEAAIKNLPLKYRLTVLLRDYEQMHYAEIARILNINLPTLKTRLHRSRIFLRQGLESYFQDQTIPAFNPRLKASLGKTQCVLATRFLERFMSEDLPAKQRRSFKQHISDCRSCRKFTQAFQKAVSLTKSLQCEDIPPALAQKILSFLKG
ncbi:MAG: sigma-70 family RNA polymerase sigma factor [Candidatus Omnitrophota bacterium]